MALKKVEKDRIKQDFAENSNDTGSTELQIAMLTERITQITAHLALFKQDNAGKRGLLTLVSRRRALLKYLAKKDAERYKNILSRLNLKR
jgi:small subunit ribosomal protein S15